MPLVQISKRSPIRCKSSERRGEAEAKIKPQGVELIDCVITREPFRPAPENVPVPVDSAQNYTRSLTALILRLRGSAAHRSMHDFYKSLLILFLRL